MAEPRMLAGRYRLDEPLGEHPTRWLAHDQDSDRVVVVTRVETGATGTAGEEIAGRAGRAATDVVRKLADVDTPAVIAPTEALLDGGELWVVRAHADAAPLTEHELDERGLARVGADVAGALVAAHGAGVVHGDVRADAMLVRPDGSGALAGFATTAPRDVAPAVETAHPEPERVAGRPAGPSADVYSLGAALGAAFDRAGITPSERMAAALRTMRAEFADVRPTAWAAQQRLTTVATAEPAAPQSAAAPADPTRVRADADNAATSIVTRPQGGSAAAAVGAGAVAVGGSDPRATAGYGGAANQQSWAAEQSRGGASPSGQWSAAATAQGGSGGYGSPAGGTPPGSHGVGGQPVPPGGTPPGGHLGPGGGGPGAARPSNKKGWIVAAVAVLAAVGLLAALVTIQPVISLAGVAAAPPGTKPPPPSLLGDLKTVNPCSLVDPAALGGVGRTQELSGFGDVAGCSFGVNRPSDYGYVSVTVAAKSLSPPSGVPSKTGDLTVHRTSEYQRTCSRTIVLPDGYRVEFYAGAGTNDTTFPVCTLADTATDSAVSIINARKVGHRELDVPRTSLLSVRACNLVDPAALSSVPSLRPLRERGFNDWSCSYGADPSFPTGARVYITYTRYSNLDGGDGIFTLDGRSAATFPSKSGLSNCEIAVAQRSFTAPAGNQRLEVMSVRVGLATGQPGASAAAACQKATDLARSAIPRMPPTQ